MRTSSTKVQYLLLSACLILVVQMSAFAQGKITGKVTDGETGLALGGVSVKAKIAGKIIGAFTNKDGTFEIKNVPPGTFDLTATYVGYKASTQKITVADNGEATANFKMNIDLLLLEEAVVVGYGTKQKKDITGAIASVTAKEFKDIPVNNIEQVLQGRAAGVQIISANGLPGAPVTVRVRGTSSIRAGSNPLYVIDGIPIASGDYAGEQGRQKAGGFNSGSLADLNPNDIESIEVLKDADAAAIYGARGANGVVLITTKRGGLGATKLNFSYYTGFSSPSRKVDFYDGPGFLSLWEEANKNDSLLNPRSYRRKALPGNIGYGTGQIAPANTDWIDLVLQTGRINEASVSASGGNEKTRFYSGVTYRNESGYMKLTNFERITGRLNLDHDVSDNVTLGVTASVTRTQDDRRPVAWGGGLGWAQSSALPIFPIRNPDGTFFLPRQFGPNPVARQEELDYSTVAYRTIGGISAEYRPDFIPGLSLRFEGGLDLRRSTENYYISEIVAFQAFAEKRDVQVTNWNTNLTLSYDTKITDDQQLKILVGTSAQRNDQVDVGATGREFSNSFFKNPSSAVIREGYSFETAFSFLSYFARVNYKIQDKYLFNISFRADGSSRFGANKQYGYFPAASLGWIISEESFLKTNELLTFLKLSASYGLLGNAEGIPDFAWRGTYSAGANYNGLGGIVPSRLANPNLSWEQTSQMNINVDFGLLQGRISGTLTYYNKQTKDLLLEVSVPSSIGFGSLFQNVGELENSGIEILLSSKNLIGEFQWSTDLNLAFNRNKVIDNAGLAPDALAGQGETRVLPGYAVGTFFMNRFAGVQNSDGQVSLQRRSSDNTTKFGQSQSGRWIDTTVFVAGGSPLFYNLNGKVTDVFSLDDRVPLGQPYADVIGGLNNNFSYKGFDLNILVNFSFGNQVYDDAAKRQVGNMAANFNQRKNETEQRWKVGADNSGATVPRLTFGLNGNRDINIDRWLYKGDFIRVRQITLGYTLPSDIVSSLGITSLRIYASSLNPFLFTSYPGWDPEIYRDQDSDQARNLSASVTYLTPPQARVFTFGFNLNF